MPPRVKFYGVVCKKTSEKTDFFGFEKAKQERFVKYYLHKMYFGGMTA